MMEIGRWVRGWGDKVEVLAPLSLREELRDEAVRTARTVQRQAEAYPRATTSQRPRIGRLRRCLGHAAR